MNYDKSQSVQTLLLSLLLIALTVVSRRYCKVPSQVVEFVKSLRSKYKKNSGGL